MSGSVKESTEHSSVIQASSDFQQSSVETSSSNVNESALSTIESALDESLAKTSFVAIQDSCINKGSLIESSNISSSGSESLTTETVFQTSSSNTQQRSSSMIHSSEMAILSDSSEPSMHNDLDIQNS